MKFFNIKATKLFSHPTAVDVAKKELNEAQMKFLEYQTHTEYYAAQVEFEVGRIGRLQNYIASIENPKAPSVTAARKTK